MHTRKGYAVTREVYMGKIHCTAIVLAAGQGKRMGTKVHKQYLPVSYTHLDVYKRQVSDGVIAPGYEPEALEILKQKKNGNYNVIEIDPNYVPAPLERKEVFGITFEQGRNELMIDD